MHYNQLSSNLSLIIKASRFSGMPLLSQIDIEKIVNIKTNVYLILLTSNTNIMRKVLFLGALLGLFSTSNMIASELENINIPVEITSVIKANEDNVNYWVTNVRTIPETNGSYLYFTVNWEYTGNRPNPAIAFMVYIYNGSSLENSFQDSAYGIREGSRDYKIKVFSNTSYSVVVNGSDGGPR